MRTKARVIIGDSRTMTEVADDSVDLVVTSPPYWTIKDYGVEGQIGYGQTLHRYLRGLHGVWRECFRVVRPGRRCCINVGDQFARGNIFGRYRVIPLHAEIIAQCEDIGFDYMGSIIWRKKTTMNTTGGATVMGSYPHPPNGLVEIDHEYIMLFRKPGRGETIPREIRERSALTKEEWKQYFSGHWSFGGARQTGHEAVFPEELPRRLIRMFSCVDDVVLDPFLGSGTTVRVALELGRNAVGYEINESFVKGLVEGGAPDESGPDGVGPALSDRVQVIRGATGKHFRDAGYVPRIRDAEPVAVPDTRRREDAGLHRVAGVRDAHTLVLDDGLEVSFLGVEILDRGAVLEYLEKFVLNRQVSVRYDGERGEDDRPSGAYVSLKNGISINSYLIRSGMARADRTCHHRRRKRFMELEANA